MELDGWFVGWLVGWLASYLVIRKNLSLDGFLQVEWMK
jgi:hypothetical protein